MSVLLIFEGKRKGTRERGPTARHCAHFVSPARVRSQPAAYTTPWASRCACRARAEVSATGVAAKSGPRSWCERAFRHGARPALNSHCLLLPTQMPTVVRDGAKVRLTPGEVQLINATNAARAAASAALAAAARSAPKPPAPPPWKRGRVQAGNSEDEEDSAPPPPAPPPWKRGRVQAGSSEDEEDSAPPRRAAPAGSGAGGGAPSSSAREAMAASFASALYADLSASPAMLIARASGVPQAVADAWVRSLDVVSPYSGPVSGSPFAQRISKLQLESLPRGFKAHLNGGDVGNAESAGGAVGDVPLMGGALPLASVSNYATPREGRQHLAANPHTQLFGVVARAHGVASHAIALSRSGASSEGSAAASSAGGAAASSAGGAAASSADMLVLPSLGSSVYFDGFPFVRDPEKRNMAPCFLPDNGDAVAACVATWGEVVKAVEMGELRSVVTHGGTQLGYLDAAVAARIGSRSYDLSIALLAFSDVVAAQSLGLNAALHGANYGLGVGGCHLSALPSGDADPKFLLEVRGGHASDVFYGAARAKGKTTLATERLRYCTSKAILGATIAAVELGAVPPPLAAEAVNALLGSCDRAVSSSEMGACWAQTPASCRTLHSPPSLSRTGRRAMRSVAAGAAAAAGDTSVLEGQTDAELTRKGASIMGECAVPVCVCAALACSLAPAIDSLPSTYRHGVGRTRHSCSGVYEASASRGGGRGGQGGRARSTSSGRCGRHRQALCVAFGAREGGTAHCAEGGRG